MARILQEFAQYLRQRLLLPERGVGAYVRWAREFLIFARPFRELGFDECLERFLAELARMPERPAWELGQAKDAVRVYYYQFRRAGQPASAAVATARLRSPGRRRCSDGAARNRRRAPECRRPDDRAVPTFQFHRHGDISTGCVYGPGGGGKRRRRNHCPTRCPAALRKDVLRGPHGRQSGLRRR